MEDYKDVDYNVDENEMSIRYWDGRSSSKWITL